MGEWRVSNSSTRAVYNEEQCVNQVGTIVQNEAYAYDSIRAAEDYNIAKIYFLSSTGARYGYIKCGGLFNDPIFRSLYSCRLGTIVLDGKTYGLFEIQRRAEELYNPSGSQIGTLPIGTKIAVDSDSYNGQTMPYLLHIKGYLGEIWVTGSFFVDTGIRTGSGAYWSIKHAYN